MLTIRCVFFFNDTATTEIYTLSLHDALPICRAHSQGAKGQARQRRRRVLRWPVEEDGLCEGDEGRHHGDRRSEEHTSELQSQSNLVCRLLLEKKKNNINTSTRERDPTTRQSS